MKKILHLLGVCTVILSGYFHNIKPNENLDFTPVLHVSSRNNIEEFDPNITSFKNPQTHLVDYKENNNFSYFSNDLPLSV